MSTRAGEARCGGARKVPLEELREAALDHYERAATSLGEWRNQIPIAIRAHYDRLIEARDCSPPSEGAPNEG